MSGKTIAIVDDNQDLLNSYSETIKMSGYKVKSFTDPLLAYSDISANPKKYSLLITNFLMPKMNGLLLATKLVEINQKLKIIIMNDVYNLKSDYKFKILKKPISVSTLYKAVNKII